RTNENTRFPAKKVDGRGMRPVSYGLPEELGKPDLRQEGRGIRAVSESSTTLADATLGRCGGLVYSPMKKTYKARSVVVLLLIVSSLFTVSVLISSPQPAASLVVRPEERAWRQHPTRSENFFSPAAEALRQGNLQEARQNLDSVASRHPEQAALARVLAGFYAHQAGDLRQAEEILSTAATPGGSLE